MMGQHVNDGQLFSYRIDLEKRVRRDHPLRRVEQLVDFTFVRQEVGQFYGRNGNVSVDPVVILKLIFLLFWDNVPSERELMAQLPERLDYLWFLGYGMDDWIPDHSVLSKARKRWGQEVFEKLFTHTVQQCVRAGLVDGHKLHVDSSYVQAHASVDAVIQGPPELIAAYKEACHAVESKLSEASTPAAYMPVNDHMASTTDPDSTLVSRASLRSRPRYHHHRAVDDVHGVITAVETTTGSIPENRKLLAMVQQHEENTGCPAASVVADRKYGTVENYVACQQRGLRTHMADLLQGQKDTNWEGIYRDSDFHYDAQTNTYRCPAGKTMRPRRLHKWRRAWEYITSKNVCAHCSLRSHCTRAKTGRSIKRHEHHEELMRARAQASSGEARRDRRRRQHLMERSFADAANNHGFKRSRWRRLWRQKIQDWCIAAIQNVRILMGAMKFDRANALPVIMTLKKLGFWTFLVGPSPGAALKTKWHLPQPSALLHQNIFPWLNFSLRSQILFSKTPFGQHALKNRPQSDLKEP